MKKQLLLFCTMVLVLAITAIGNATPVQWTIADGGNGNYYDIIEVSINWADANTAATSNTYLGITGHLATITSQAENYFISSNVGLGNNEQYGKLHLKWLGGSQPVGSTEPNGGWQWVTGESFSLYNNFASGEPNNSGGYENRIAFDHAIIPNVGKQWNDVPDTNLLNGYVVEYNASAPVPEPATMLLFGLGILGLARVSRRRK